MTIELAPELQQLVEEQVKAGAFPSSSAAIEEAVRQMFAEPSVQELDELRALIDEGIADADAGRFVDFTAESVIAECRKEFDAKRT